MTDVLTALQQMVPGGFDRNAIASRFGAVDYDDTDPSRIRLTYTNRNDLTIPIGTWTLRLVPRLDPVTGGERVVMDLLKDAAGDIREVRVDVARFELEADPRHLAAGHLRTEPFTHITPMGGAPPRKVRLLGPGLTVGLRGPNLSEPFVDLTGASGGIQPALPSMRFDPPHFLVGRGVGAGDLVGIACDEALLDLSPTVSPPGPQGTTLPPTWTGLYLKDLGLFLNNDPANDTWSFMARMQDFYVGFEGFDLSGTLSAELVHHVVESPQLSLEAVWQTDGGSIESLPTTALPAPTGDRTYRRVRLVVRPSWDSAGFGVHWELPEGVEAEEPLRLDQPDVGWLKVEPGTHTVNVTVTDHRVPTQTASQLLAVGVPTGTAANRLRVEAVGRVIGASGGPDGPAHRIHVHLQRSANLRLVARLAGGAAAATSARVTLLASDIDIATSSPTATQTVTVTRPAGGTFPDIEWWLRAQSGAPAEGAIGVGVELTPGPVGPTTVGTDRLRYSLDDGAAPNAPDIRVDAVTDWLAEPGGGLARVSLFGGLNGDHLTWSLESREMTADELDSSSRDAAFAAGATWPGTPETIMPPLSGNVARIEVPTQDRLWRVVASAGGGTAPDRLVLVGDELVPDRQSSHRLREAAFDEFWQVPASQREPGPTTPFRFAFESAGLHTDDHGEGPEEVPEAAAAAWAKQVLGAQALLGAIAAAGSQLRAIHLVGAASTEGSGAFNTDLGMARARAVEGFLHDVRDGSPPPWVTSVPAEAPAAIAAATITVATIGEGGNESGARRGTPNPAGDASGSGRAVVVDDRRVVAILTVAGVAIPSVSRHTYFYTGAGARPIATPPAVAPRVPRHPFEHAVFRQAHLEVELLHSELLRAQVRLTLDLKAFNDSDDVPPASNALPPLNPEDGVTTFFLEYRKILDPAGSRWTWDAAVLSDPADLNGLAVTTGGVARAIGPPLITLPALTAVAGGQLGSGGALSALALGAALATLGAIQASRVTWVGFRGRLGYGTTPPVSIRVAADYTVEYAIDVDLGPLGRLQTAPGRTLKVTFRNLGVTWTSPDRFDLDYDPMSGFALRIDDPGVFRLGEGIGRLLSVQNATVGGGQSPLWVEVELRLAIETGVFAIDTLKVRLSLDTEQLFERDAAGQLRIVSDDWLSAVSVTISKIGISANLPGVLSGRGQLEITGSGGTSTVAGDLDIELVPLHLTLGASFAMFTKPPDRRAVYLGLQANFSPGFPLGNTGVALYGLLGLTGVNIGRSIPESDRVLEWYKTPTPGVRSVDKWAMRDGAWVFGVGATLGTAPDGGITWNTAGALLVQTPGPQIMLAADSQFLTPTSDPESPLSAGLQTVILLDFENGIFMAAAELSLVRQPLIELVVPAEIYFNLRRSVDWHIRLGQWQPENKRVRASLFGGIFDAWAYIQVEGDGFTGPITLHGLCVAHGMRTSVLWGSRGARIYFEAWIEYHLGLQLSPLYVEGLLTAGGELHLGPISIGADVTVNAKVGEDPRILSLHGEACGSIKIWFVRIRGCVGIDIGDGSRTTPPPPTPLAEFAVIDSLTDEVTDRNQAPIDCALHLVFDQPVYDARGADAAIDLGTPRRVQVSPELFYEYDLTALSISPAAAIAPAAWAQPTVPDPDPAHADGARTLRLRAWEPTAFPKALDFVDGYDSQLAALLQRLCERPPSVDDACATFDDQPFGAGARWRLTRPTLETVDVLAPGGELLGGGAVVPGASAGGQLGAAVVPLPAVSFDGLAARSRALRLPARPRGQDPIGRQIRDGVAPSGRSLDRHAVVGPGDAIDVSDALIDVIPGLDDRFGPARGLGAVAIRLPDLVSAEAVVMLPAKHEGGAYRFYDAAMQPLGPVSSLYDAHMISGVTLAGPVVQHEVRSLAFDGFASAGEDGPARASWLVIWAPHQLRLPASWDAATYLLQVCGMPYGAWLAGERLAETRDRTTTWLTDALVTPASAAMATTVPMLAPDTSYTVTGTIAWRRYRNATTATADGQGTHPISETFRTAVNPPADIRRYITSIDPAGPDQPLYRTEPIVVRFASDDIDALFAAYGKQLVTRLKADLGGDSANMGVTEGRFTIATAVDSFEEAFVDALGRSCFSGDAFVLFPKTEIRTQHDLAPNTGYTLSLVPRAIAEPGSLDPAVWDRQLELAVESGIVGSVVHRTDLLASRWRDFSEHVAAYTAEATAGVGHVLADDATAAASALAALPVLSRGDLAVDALLGTLVGGPIQLPERPEIHWLWGLDSPAVDGLSLPTYRLLGIMLDGPEPLLRRRPDGTDAVELEVSAMTGAGPATAVTAKVLGGTTGARVVIAAPLAGADAVAITLHYRRAAGDTPDTRTMTLQVPAAPGVVS